MSLISLASRQDTKSAVRLSEGGTVRLYMYTWPPLVPTHRDGEWEPPKIKKQTIVITSKETNQGIVELNVPSEHGIEVSGELKR